MKDIDQDFILHPKLTDRLKSMLKSAKTPAWVKRFLGFRICEDEIAIRIQNYTMLVLCGLGVVTGIMGTLVSILALSLISEQIPHMKVSDRIIIISAPFIFLIMGWIFGRYVIRFWRLVRNPKSGEGIKL